MWFRPETGQTRNRSRTLTLAGAITALLLASLVGLTIRHSTFTPWGTDPAAYIGSAHLWARHEVVTPASLIFWASWSRDGILEAPMAHHPGLTRGTTVSDFPLGFPVLMAAAIRIGGELAPYVVPPLFAGVLGWCAYVLGSTLAGRWAGLLAAIQVVTSPITLLHSVVPMSDVPAGGLWAVSWVMSLRGGLGGAAAAGMATAMAIMIAPTWRRSRPSSAWSCCVPIGHPAPCGGATRWSSRPARRSASGWSCGLKRLLVWAPAEARLRRVR